MLGGCDGNSVRRTRQLSLTLAEDGNLPSLSPLDESSPLNQFAGQFDPLLTPVRECQVKLAITDGRPPREGDYKLWFHGYLGTDAQANTEAGVVDVTVNDLAKRLQVTVVTEAKTYAEGEPADIEDIMQQIIDDHIGTGVVAVCAGVAGGSTTGCGRQGRAVRVGRPAGASEHIRLGLTVSLH